VRPGVLLLGTCVAVCTVSMAAANPEPLRFSREEVAALLRHGPWPVPWKPDPSNRASGNSAAMELGESLFFDPRLSMNGQISCASCHVPGRGFADGRSLAMGLEEVDRRTPSLLNVRLNRWFGWDGAGDSLWAQSVRPMLDSREMGMTVAGVASLVGADPEFSCRYRRAFGTPPSTADDDGVIVNVAKALAAFQETLLSGRTTFDDFRDALAKGNRAAVARYPVAAQRGAKLFVGKGRCNLCHFGPNFTNGEFEEIGIPHYTKARGVDWGRAQGIKLMLANRFNRLSRYNDDPRGVSAESSRHVALAWRNYGEFKIPSLRNAGSNAPYMHNGHLATLSDVVRHYSELDLSRLHLGPDLVDGDGAAIDPGVSTLLKPLHLEEQEISDLVAFLRTLDEKRPRPWRASERKPCRS
jgi:cytochrome c peroxidase